ncbi:PHD and RING finger domain-containing protein [Melia azedarach]|uniref:PHD and RING finger domain-containing protein n=1 Tax=Melia azedarach TaxID=155640 RepID=A0ACC1XD60_MELAZ|nr:PHD and RING finger domain-containing protein [Melia azedarach]
MSGSTAPTFVYRRRKLRGNTIPTFSVQDPVKTKKSDDCVSVVSSDAHSVVMKEHRVVSQAEDETDAVGTPMMPSIISQSEPHLLRSNSVQEQLVSDKPPKSSKQKMVEVDSINDSCSSSKSNIELVSASMKTEVDETGECSSSSALVLEVMGKDLSEKDLCISILRGEGLLERFLPTQIRASATDVESSSGGGGGGGGSSSCSRSCKICGRSETAFKLLICDNCEEAFHVACHNPRIKKIPTDEWFCHSCFKKKHKILKETARKSPNIIGESGRERNTSTKDESSPIELMLRATEPYTTGVRIGKGCQADVPDWSTPTNSDVHTCGEPLGLDPECPNLDELNSEKPSKLSSIGNWLQCRQVLEGTGYGVDGIICGKWRRAPLFEVQTDEWECFCAIQWDPAHADCAVPQELETDEVLKQLKYIEMLRPRLAAKRRKFYRINSGPQQDSAKDLTNLGT